MSRRGVFLTLGLTLLLPGQAVARPEAAPPSPALPRTLRLEDALALVRTRGLDLLIAEAAVHGAEGDVTIAAAVQNPALGFSVGKSFLCAPGVCQGTGGLAWTASLSDEAAIENTITRKRMLRTRVAQAALAAARLGRADAWRTLEFQVKQQFVQVLLAQESLRFARDVQASLTETLALNQRRYQAGAISEADLAKIETAKLESDQAVDTALQALRAAKVGLAFQLGVRGPVPEFAVEQPDLLHYAAPARLGAPTAGALIEEALAHRPDLKAAGYQRLRAQESIRLAKRLRFPDIALSLQYTQEGTGTTAVTPPTFALGLSAPLPLFYRQQGEIQKAEADYRTTSLQQAKLVAQVVSDVETAFAAYATAGSLVRRMESRLLDRAQRARDLVKVQYLKGAASLLEFLDAERTFIATNVEYRQDLASYWTAVFQLEQAVGQALR
jgi:cobalt-zinc-cadmium efflux system outer membrane protein